MVVSPDIPDSDGLPEVSVINEIIRADPRAAYQFVGHTKEGGLVAVVLNIGLPDEARIPETRQVLFVELDIPVRSGRIILRQDGRIPAVDPSFILYFNFLVGLQYSQGDNLAYESNKALVFSAIDIPSGIDPREIALIFRWACRDMRDTPLWKVAWLTEMSFNHLVRMKKLLTVN